MMLPDIGSGNHLLSEFLLTKHANAWQWLISNGGPTIAPSTLSHTSYFRREPVLPPQTGRVEDVNINRNNIDIQAY